MTVYSATAKREVEPRIEFYKGRTPSVEDIMYIDGAGRVSAQQGLQFSFNNFAFESMCLA